MLIHRRLRNLFVWLSPCGWSHEERSHERALPGSSSDNEIQTKFYTTKFGESGETKSGRNNIHLRVCVYHRRVDQSDVAGVLRGWKRVRASQVEGLSISLACRVPYRTVYVASAKVDDYCDNNSRWMFLYYYIIYWVLSLLRISPRLCFLRLCHRLTDWLLTLSNLFKLRDDKGPQQSKLPCKLPVD